MRKGELLQIAIPSGELKDSVTNALTASGIRYKEKPRKLKINVTGMPVQLVLARASSIPEIVHDPRSITRAGVTGGDILWESGMQNEGVLLPGIESNSTLFVGVTNRLRRRVKKETGRKKPDIKDLAGSEVVTKFPKIAAEVFDGLGVEVLPMPGTTEAIQYMYPNCDGIVDVTATGATVAANRLTIIRRLLDPVPVRMISEPNLSTSQQQVLADFTGKLL